MLLAAFWLNFWVAMFVLGFLGPRAVSKMRRWWHMERVKADARRRRRVTNDATVGWARDEERLEHAVMAAERRPLPYPSDAPPHELTDGELISLEDWRASDERARLLGKADPN